MYILTLKKLLIIYLLKILLGGPSIAPIPILRYFFSNSKWSVKSIFLRKMLGIPFHCPFPIFQKSKNSLFRYNSSQKIKCKRLEMGQWKGRLILHDHTFLPNQEIHLYFADKALYNPNSFIGIIKAIFYVWKTVRNAGRNIEIQFFAGRNITRNSMKTHINKSREVGSIVMESNRKKKPYF